MQHMSRWAALALALVLVLVLGACGVAHFDDSGDWTVDEKSSASEGDPLREEREALLAKRSELVDAYNEGVAEFEAAIEDKVDMPKGLSEDYDKVGENLGEYQDAILAGINDMTEDELKEMDKKLDNVALQVENLRLELEKAVVRHAQEPQSAVTSG